MSSENMRINATRTAAIAATNKLMVHLNLGPMTEYVINPSTQQVDGYVCVDIDGRISRDEWQMTWHRIICKPKSDESAGYRAKLIYISTPDPQRKHMSDPWIHFMCTFEGYEITVTKIDRPPFAV